MAKEALDQGFYVSISGIVTFKNAANVRDVAAKVPADRLLIETIRRGSRRYQNAVKRMSQPMWLIRLNFSPNCVKHR
jgi:hypothetical protein